LFDSFLATLVMWRFT